MAEAAKATAIRDLLRGALLSANPDEAQLHRLVQLYETTNQPEEAAERRRKLAEADTTAAAQQTGPP